MRTRRVVEFTMSEIEEIVAEKAASVLGREGNASQLSVEWLRRGDACVVVTWEKTDPPGRTENGACARCGSHGRDPDGCHNGCDRAPGMIDPGPGGRR